MCTRMDGYDSVVILIMAIKEEDTYTVIVRFSEHSKRLHGVVAGIGRNGKLSGDEW